MIKIHFATTRSSGTKIKVTSLQLSQIRTGLASVYVDPKISARMSIGLRLNQVKRDIHKLEADVNRLQQFIVQSVDQYNQAEDRITRTGQTLQPLLGRSAANQVISKTDSTSTDKEEAKSLWDYIMENGWEASKAFMGGMALLNARNLLRLGKDMGLKFEKDGGKVFLKLIDKGASPASYQKYRDLLMSHLGGTASDYRKGLVNRLTGTGITLYNDDNRSWFQSNRNRFSTTLHEDLNQYVQRLEYGGLRNTATNAFKTGLGELKFWEGLKVTEGWSGATNFTKFSKAAGAFGVVTMLTENGTSAYDSKTGKMDWLQFGVDSAVDVGTGAAAMATGAAIGTAFLPPLGTAVGAAAGAGINLLINTKFPPSGDSLVDITKEKANQVADKVVESVGECVSNIGKKLDSVFW